jgi:hypothetical protein
VLTSRSQRNSFISGHNVVAKTFFAFAHLAAEKEVVEVTRGKVAWIRGNEQVRINELTITLAKGEL